jgi:hypothetical protein
VPKIHCDPIKNGFTKRDSNTHTQMYGHIYSFIYIDIRHTEIIVCFYQDR